MLIPADTILFAGSDCEPDMIQAAREYCHNHGLTIEDAKIRPCADKGVYVITRRTVTLTEESQGENENRLEIR